MHILERLAPLESITSPKTIPIGARGVVFVSELRPYHRDELAVVVALEDPGVTSGRGGHCRFSVLEGSVWVVDEGSDNGTWVRRENSDFRAGSFRSPTKLHAGDIVCVGRHQFRVTELDAEAPTDTPLQQ